MSNRIAVIGGGAAGMFVAVTALQRGAAVTLFERNSLLGKKLGITGKGRCNLTNACSPEDFINNLTANGRFMYSAINRFTPSDTVSFFESLGVPLKVERGNRVFPVSDSANDIVMALKNALLRLGCVVENSRVTGLTRDNGKITGIVRREGTFTDFDSVILCTGGASYPLTGSTGDGYRIAGEIGHTVTPLSPSLVGLTSDDPVCAECQGLALKNVAVSVLDKASGKTVYRDFGEMLFCHFGLSGPVILSASAHIRPMESGRYVISIDLKPALSEQVLDARLLTEFDNAKNRNFSSVLPSLLPKSLIPPFCRACGISGETKVNAITREARKRVLGTLKDFRIDVSGFRPISEAIVTHGGIKVSEIEPSSMRSKLYGNLYFAGEIIDVDAYTGGFNLQIAFSTGYAAAVSASGEYTKEVNGK